MLLTVSRCAVIGERLVTAGAFVQLVFKARVVPTFAQVSKPPKQDPEDSDAEEEVETAFLMSKGEAEDMPSYKPEWSHAPHWPSVSLPYR
jgi:translocation protein SEC63